MLVKQRFGRQNRSFTWVLATFQKVRWVQEAKELTLSVLEDVSRRKFDAGPNTLARGAEGTAADLQATASAADPSSIRRIDVWIQSALVSSISSAGQILVRPVVVGQLYSVINRMQHFHNEEWHSDLEVNILSNLASISARFNSSDGTASLETQTG